MIDAAILSVQAIVNLLDRKNPLALAQLRKNHPSQAVLLQPGRHLGEGSPPPGDMLRELASSTIALAKSESLSVSQVIRRRIRLSSRLRLVGSLVSSLSAGGLIAALAGGSPRVALVSGCVTFASSFFTLIAQYVEDYAGGQNSLRELRDRVMTHVAEAHEVDAEFRLMSAKGDFSGIDLLVRKLNVAVASLRQIQMAVE